MPTYEYACDANGRSVEVMHGMRETMGTWGELCARAEIDPGATPLEAPVLRTLVASTLQITGRSVGSDAQGVSGGSGGPGGCGHGCGCGGH
jgi:hypothetical protein